MSAFKAMTVAAGTYLMASLSGAWAQSAPSINTGGIVNAASYTAPVAPGSIVSVYGDFLLSEPSGALSVPLPTNLGGLSFDFGSTAAPLFYASNGQVNMQVPWGLTGDQASLTASINGQTSAAQTVNLAPVAPGIFTINSQGTGAGAILDSSYNLVGPSNPAGAGVTVILVYCTGLGPVTNTPATGSAASGTQLSVALTTPTATIGGVNAPVTWAGLAPGTVGEYQVNVQVPANAPTGDAVPLILYSGSVASNTVTVAVQPPTPDQRAGALVSQMTQAQEIQLVYGAGGPVTNDFPLPRGAAGYVPGIPELGIPDLYLADGSVGVGNGVGQATALPSSIASAASWDVNEAYKYGTVIGDRIARLRHERESGRQHQPDRARAARRAHLRNQGRRPHPGRQDYRRAHQRHPGPARDRRHQALRAERSGERAHHGQRRSSTNAACARAICWPSRSA